MAKVRIVVILCFIAFRCIAQDSVSAAKWTLSSVGVIGQVGKVSYMEPITMAYMQIDPYDYVRNSNESFQEGTWYFSLFRPNGMGLQLNWQNEQANKIRFNVAFQEEINIVRFFRSGFNATADTFIQNRLSASESHHILHLQLDFIKPVIKIIKKKLSLYVAGGVDVNHYFEGKGELDYNYYELPVDSVTWFDGIEFIHYGDRTNEKIEINDFYNNRRFNVGVNAAIGGEYVLHRNQNPFIGLQAEVGYKIGIQHIYGFSTNVKDKRYLQLGLNYYL